MIYQPDFVGAVRHDRPYGVFPQHTNLRNAIARAACLESIAALKTEQPFFLSVLPKAILRNPHSLQQNFQQVLDLGLRPQQIIFELTEVEVLAHCPE